jgi:hypothetical protein
MHGEFKFLIYLIIVNIKKINKDDFKEFSRLQELYLSNNNISVIKTNTLVNLKSIQKIATSYNSMTEI